MPRQRLIRPPAGAGSGHRPHRLGLVLFTLALLAPAPITAAVLYYTTTNPMNVQPGNPPWHAVTFPLQWTATAPAPQIWFGLNNAYRSGYRKSWTFTLRAESNIAPLSCAKIFGYYSNGRRVCAVVRGQDTYAGPALTVRSTLTPQPQWEFGRFVAPTGRTYRFTSYNSTTACTRITTTGTTATLEGYFESDRDDAAYDSLYFFPPDSVPIDWGTAPSLQGPDLAFWTPDTVITDPFGNSRDGVLFVTNGMPLSADSLQVFTMSISGQSTAPTQFLCFAVDNAHTIDLELDYTGSVTAAPEAGPVLAAEIACTNPVRGATDIRYAIAAPARVRLQIYDARGRIVRTAIPGALVASGRHTWHWDGLDDHRNRVRPGIYFGDLNANGIQRTAKLVVIR